MCKGKAGERWWKLPRGIGFRRFKGLKPGKRQARMALTREGYVQAKGRLQCWNADGQELGGSCREGYALVEAAARGFTGLKPGKRQARRP